MDELAQKKAPYIEALKKYIAEDVSPFDVPGHHMGNVENAFTKFLGHDVYRADVNAPVGMDNLANPRGVILESEKLMAEACGQNYYPAKPKPYSICIMHCKGSNFPSI